VKTQSTRLDGLGTTIFAEMSALALRTDSVNLGQGFPDTDGPASVIEAVEDAMHHGRNQYAPGIGVPELREAIAGHQKRWYGLDVDPDTQVAVSTGATEAIAAALLGLVDPGDEVVVLEPYYDSYVAVIQMAGGVRRPVTLRAPDFRLPVDELQAAITPRTTTILLNSPHNPTGMVLTRDELEAVAAVARAHDLVVITDEVYEHLTYDDVEHIPMATLPGMAERTLTISSGGKTFSFTGWKVGWATGPAELVAAMVGAKQFMTYTSGAPFQPAIAQALELGDDYFESLRARMEAQRDLLCEGLEAIGFDVFVPEGGYFATTDIRPLGFDDGMEFCRLLPERAGVVAIPHQVFYDHKDVGRPLVRWAFSKKPDVIDEAVRRLGVLRP
jgi:N-succinyldiaminopimelate aminotransferase